MCITAWVIVGQIILQDLSGQPGDPVFLRGNNTNARTVYLDGQPSSAMRAEQHSKLLYKRNSQMILWKKYSGIL